MKSLEYIFHTFLCPKNKLHKVILNIDIVITTKRMHLFEKSCELLSRVSDCLIYPAASR